MTFFDEKRQQFADVHKLQEVIGSIAQKAEVGNALLPSKQEERSLKFGNK
jgi:hypothetical protein